MASTSTPSTGAAPAAVPNTTPASAPSKRHRIRKPAATQRVAATSDSSSQPSTAENGTATHHARPDGHWRGGPSRGGAPRGRGNGAGRGRGAATRGFSSTSREEAVRASSSRDVNDLGHRLARHGLGPALDPSAVKDLSGQREFSTTSAPAETALEAQVPPSGRRKKGKGKQDGTGSGVDEAAALLQRVALKEGEAGGFDEEVQRLFEAQRASPEALEARAFLIAELEDFFNRENFRWGHYHNARLHPIEIEAFGSVRFGLATSKSDLDLCLFDPYRPNGFEEKYFSSSKETAKLPDIYDMRQVGNKLRAAGLGKVQPIPFAGVPIVKFEARIGNEVIQADINTNERLGVLNSRLINAYCDLHPSIRPLCVFIKFWASQRDLNDPSGQAGPVTFSSYTLILLVIAYLQSISLVPNLQAADLIAQQGVERRRFFSTPKARIRRGKLNGIKGSTGWDTTFVEKVPGWEVQEVGLKELARGFFDYYGRQFQGEEEVVSIQNGAPFPRSTPFFTLLDELEAEVQQKATLGDGQVSTQEQRRQDAEDDLLADFAREVEREKDPTAAAAAEELERDEVKAASRSSSPFLYEEFDEPGIWSRRPLVVQDPFDLTRNTAGNIESDIMEAFQKEMLTARDLIDSNTSIAVICASIKTEPGYRSLQDVRKGWRKRKVNALKQERVKLERGAGAGRDLVEELHVQEEQVLRPVDVTEEVVGAQETEQGGEEEEDGFSAAFDDEDEDGSEPRAL